MEPPPEASAPRRLAVADILRIRRPTTGASSLVSSSPSSATSTSPPRKKPKHPAPSPAHSTAPFAPIPQPVLLAGMLSLSSASSPAACRNHCLSLSDPSSAASVCCYLLDFDPAAIGREIRVLAWNFLPSIDAHGAGVLEVVRWCLAEAPELVPHPSFLTTIPLNCVDAEPDLATRGRVFGVVMSVSVMFNVQKSKADGGGDSVGFIVEMMCCGCRQCRASHPERDQDHKFEVEKFVYFVDSASRWRPVLARLIARLVSVTGLKKKMVSVGKKGSYTMLVSSTKTLVAWCPSYVGVPPSDQLPGKCGGLYSGVVSGIYMQGMLVELDEIAWLLIDDKQLLPSHSLRVGAVISVRNFQAVRQNFAWTSVVLLGTCSKTSITMNSFSLVDSKCHLRTESRDLLVKSVESLELSDRFWMLLLTSCFKQKFTKLFSKEEISGLKNMQGLVHTYATKVLSSKGSKSQHDFFMKFCNHNCGSSCTGSNLEACKLVIPFANFICKGESLWISTMLKFWNSIEKVSKHQGLKHFLCDGVSSPSTTKRMISSGDLGLVLVGSIKMSSIPGRLQLVDDTGCIDLVIPDIPPNVCMDGIYEINDCKLALEGPVAYLDHFGVADPLSCKAVLEKLSYRKSVHHLKIYGIVHWSELNLIGPSSHIPLQTIKCARLFHLLKLSHIFPAISDIQHHTMPGPSLYAEAVIVPYNLKFTGRADCIEHPESFKVSSTSSLYNSKVSMEKPCHIPCSLSFRTTNLSGTLVSSYCCGPDGTVLIDTSTTGGEQGHTSRILLEFKEGCFLKYQLLRIGGYYLLECPSNNHSFAVKDCGCFQGGKISLHSQDNLWSLSITFNGNINMKQGIVDQSIGISSAEVDEPFSRNTIHNEIKLVKSWTDFRQCSDFHLQFYCEAVREKMEEYDTICYVLNELCSYSNEVMTVSSCIEIMMHKKPFSSSNLENEKLVQGDLISLHGKVENIHSLDCKEGRRVPGFEKCSICIHVADHNQTVRLRGYLSKNCYPVGLGPGAVVTFHRVLLTQHELLLTQVTYIEVTSINHTDLNREHATPLMPDGLKDGSLTTISPCVILHQKHFTDSGPIQFQCRMMDRLCAVAGLMMQGLNFCLGCRKSPFWIFLLI
ncbi:hypothetical protein BRADI_4g29310v3 [Brachypodium distachyon]|uniref:CST complex subunit CTC1 n=1 Tax=Brachypodium distachyon TaxID=15368 RepID=A0A0Q3ERL2_BRADI|nr:hypothetical protein BRADI_4g29310v3 [Brachypodium distachyon]